MLFHPTKTNKLLTNIFTLRHYQPLSYLFLTISIVIKRKYTLIDLSIINHSVKKVKNPAK